MIDLDTYLSRFFKLSECVKDDVDELRPEHVSCLTKLSNWVLDPLRVRFGPLRVNSGWRSQRHNDALRARGLGASQTSAHLYGGAADLVSIDGHSPGEMCAWLAMDGKVLPYDQAIDEYRHSAWLHIGIQRPGNIGNPRRQLLAMRVVDGVDTYSDWLESSLGALSDLEVTPTEPQGGGSIRG